MAEEQKESILEQNLDEAAQQASENTEVVEQEQQAPEAEASEVPQQEQDHLSKQNLRFDVLRRAREEAERERDELKRRLEQLEAARNKTPKAEHQEEEHYSIGEDDFVEGKHLKRYDSEIKRLKKEINEYKQQSYAQTVETRLKSQYRDFDSVVNKENLEILSSAYPEIASTLQSSPDLYSKAVSAYTMIKKFGIVDTKDYTQSKAKTQSNVAKPKPAASINSQGMTESPLSQANAFANGLTPELKAQLYREMIEAKNNR